MYRRSKGGQLVWIAQDAFFNFLKRNFELKCIRTQSYRCLGDRKVRKLDDAKTVNKPKQTLGKTRSKP